MKTYLSAKPFTFSERIIRLRKKYARMEAIINDKIMVGAEATLTGLFSVYMICWMVLRAMNNLRTFAIASQPLN